MANNNNNSLANENVANLQEFTETVDLKYIQEIENMADRLDARIREVYKFLTELDNDISEAKEVGVKRRLQAMKEFYLEEKAKLEDLRNLYASYQQNIGKFEGGKRKIRKRNKKTRRNSRRR